MLMRTDVGDVCAGKNWAFNGALRVPNEKLVEICQ